MRIGTRLGRGEMTEKEGKGSDIPDWDGTVETWEDFTTRTDVYCRQVEPWKESQQISKIIGKFSTSKNNRVWKLLQALSETEREKLFSKTALLTFLKSQMLESAIPELGRHFRLSLIHI